MKSIPKSIQLFVDANYVLAHLVAYSRDYKQCVNHPRWMRLQAIMYKTKTFWSDDASKFVDILRSRLDTHRNAYTYDEIMAEMFEFEDSYGDKIRPYMEGSYKWL